MWWLVLLQFTAACAAIGHAASGVVRVTCWALAGLLLVLSAVPTDGRWLIQRIAGGFAVRSRARIAQAQRGIAVVVGQYTVTSIRGNDDTDFGVARTATTAALIIEVRSDDLFNCDPPFRLADLAPLLSVEGVPLQAVRLLVWSVRRAGRRRSNTRRPGFCAGP
jgi:hypothetical protein